MRLLGTCASRKFALFSFRLGKAVEHSRFHRTRANDVDTNAYAGEFEGRRLRDAFHGPNPVLHAQKHIKHIGVEVVDKIRTRQTGAGFWYSACAETLGTIHA